VPAELIDPPLALVPAEALEPPLVLVPAEKVDPPLPGPDPEGSPVEHPNPVATKIVTNPPIPNVFIGQPG
jgi:hypothetical protein